MNLFWPCSYRISVTASVLFFLQGCTFVVIFGLPGGKHEDDGYRSLKAGHLIYESLHSVAEIT